MPQSHKISTEELAQTLKDCKGDYGKAAEKLNVSRIYVRDRVSRDKKLRAIYIKSGTSDPVPDSVEILARNEDVEIKNKQMLKNLKRNGRDAFENDIKSMLSNPDSVKKLEVFKNFDDSVGMLMAEALRITQKLNIRQNLSLFEITEQLKEELMDETMDFEEKNLKTRLLIQACEQQGKFHDRLLKGLEFQLKLANEKDKRETKKKPGFRPLKELKDVEEAEASGTN